MEFDDDESEELVVTLVYRGSITDFEKNWGIKN